MSASFLYQSAKDVLKWNSLSPRRYIKTVMSIGAIYHLSEKQFQEYLNENVYLDMTLEDLKEQYNK